jgi:hypothetical protein
VFFPERVVVGMVVHFVSCSFRFVCSCLLLGVLLPGALLNSKSVPSGHALDPVFQGISRSLPTPDLVLVVDRGEARHELLVGARHVHR